MIQNFDGKNLRDQHSYFIEAGGAIRYYPMQVGGSETKQITERIFRIKWWGTGEPKKDEFVHLFSDYYFKKNQGD